MHCCLAVCARAKVLLASSVSRALSLPILKDRGTAKTMQMTVNDCLVHFMAQLQLRSITAQRPPVNGHSYDRQ
jgi:hypothetical protein